MRSETRLRGRPALVPVSLFATAAQVATAPRSYHIYQLGSAPDWARFERDMLGNCRGDLPPDTAVDPMSEPTDKAPAPSSSEAEEQERSHPDPRQKDSDGPSMTADEEEALTQRLRELGYIE